MIYLSICILACSGGLLFSVVEGDRDLLHGLGTPARDVDLLVT